MFLNFLIIFVSNKKVNISEYVPDGIGLYFSRILAQLCSVLHNKMDSTNSIDINAAKVFAVRDLV